MHEGGDRRASASHDEQAEAAPRLEAIDALRGIACLAVVFFHFGMWWGNAAGRGWSSITEAETGVVGTLVATFARFGYLGVGLFLSLSGFCLYYPVARRPRAARVIALASFFARRARRLLPPYWASVAIMVAVAASPWAGRFILAPVSTLDVVTHVLLVHNLVPSAIWTMNGAYWSLALEWQLYIVFPLAVLFARRFGAKAVVVAGACVWIAWMAGLRHAGYGDVSGEIYGVLYESLPARFFEFACGMWAAEVVAERRPASRLGLGLVALVFAPCVWAVHVERLTILPVDNIACGLSFAACIVLFARVPARVVAALPMRALERVGVVSYSLYLVHQPLQLASRELSFDVAGDSFVRAMAFAALAGVPVLLLVAKAYYELLEAPFLKKGTHVSAPVA